MAAPGVRGQRLTDAAPVGGQNAKHMIRGERVFLRAAERSDLPLFVNWLNDAETASFITARAPMSMAMEEQWFEKVLVDHGTSRWHFVICLVESGQPIGTIGLFELDLATGSAGMGIVIGEKQLWGQGYGTDAHNALLDFAFGSLRLERVWLEVNDDNFRAKRSYEKCGFKFEGTERHAMFRAGKHHDLDLMSILRDEWSALDRKRSWDY